MRHCFCTYFCFIPHFLLYQFFLNVFAIINQNPASQETTEKHQISNIILWGHHNMKLFLLQKYFKLRFNWLRKCYNTFTQFHRNRTRQVSRVCSILLARDPVRNQVSWSLRVLNSAVFSLQTQKMLRSKLARNDFNWINLLSSNKNILSINYQIQFLLLVFKFLACTPVSSGRAGSFLVKTPEDQAKLFSEKKRR